ncbi:MAG: bifunctional phosphopantothenoylcysteine decarboxylase/phosphopantothenate--cysteine ligase CoaBC, partial [Calditrichia bacterium]|nr:bifunctional phosphopantothenoylcysteine decarboxylase/phosphopantothenate--cysteine ligase CoaBC [Calditrichia bacterium]
IVQDNISYLKKRDFIICPPDYGTLACGYSGFGRLAPFNNLEQYLRYALQSKKDLKGKNVLITLGPTREYLDPVRYISNFSSGNMGLQLALEAFSRGAKVTVISGPVDLPIPSDINWINIETAGEMSEEVENHFDNCDYFFSAAAVADYRPADVSDHKMKKKEEHLSILLEPTVDILKQCSYNKKIKKKNQKVFGFALESNDILENGLAKLDKKNLDGIVINSAIQKNGGMGSDRNAVILVNKAGKQKEIKNKPKEMISRDIFDFFI